MGGVLKYLKQRWRTLFRPAHLKLGERGERIARLVLERSGMEYLACNYRCRNGEIDLIFREHDVLCLVEVKTRHRSRFAPETAVNWEKKKRISRAGRRYIRQQNLRGRKVRCDIVEVIFEGRKLAEVHHLRNAFELL